MGHLVQLLRERRQVRILRTYEILNQLSILQKKIPSLMSLIALMYSIAYLGWKTIFIGLVSEIWAVRRVLTQKQWKLDQTSVNYVILNQDVPLSASHLYYSFQNVSNTYVGPIKCTYCYIEPNCTSMGLKTLIINPF